MKNWRFYALGAWCAAAAAAGILAGSCGGSAAVPEVENNLPAPANWYPETVSFAIVSGAQLSLEERSGGPVLRATDGATLANEDACGRNDAVSGRSEVAEYAAAVGERGAFPASVRIVPDEWTDEDVELLARLLWSSPLRNEDAKRQLVWVVLNRVDDERPVFARTIAGNVTRKEFTFFDRKAYVSETNARIAREELERWTRVLSGLEERPVPEGYVYLRFAGDGNRMIYLMREIGGEAL